MVIFTDYYITKFPAYILIVRTIPRCSVTVWVWHTYRLVYYKIPSVCPHWSYNTKVLRYCLVSCILTDWYITKFPAYVLIGRTIPRCSVTVWVRHTYRQVYHNIPSVYPHWSYNTMMFRYCLGPGILTDWYITIFPAYILIGRITSRCSVTVLVPAYLQTGISQNSQRYVLIGRSVPRCSVTVWVPAYLQTGISQYSQRIYSLVM